MMQRRLLVCALVIVMAFAVSASGFVVPAPDIQEDINSTRIIPSDPKLPKYDNPIEIDLEEGSLHISFQGVFRPSKDEDTTRILNDGEVALMNNAKDWIAFAFIITPKKDMEIRLDQSSLHDGKGRQFDGNADPYIGYASTWSREIIGGVTYPVLMWFRVYPSTAGVLPTVSRVNIIFNGQSFQFRNIKAEEWSVWENIKHELDI